MNVKIITAACLASGLATAATPIDGWYLSAFGGYTFLPDNIYRIYNNLILNGTSYNNGYNAGGRVGYRGNPIRYELEYTYLSASNTGFMVNGIVQKNSLAGTSTGNLVMANIYYDFPDMLPAIAPFLGVGIGYSNIHATLSSTGPIPPGGTYFSATQNSFAYQGTTGLTYNFAETYAVNISYRYVATGKNGVFGRVFQAHNADLGVLYRFDYGNYK